MNFAIEVEEVGPLDSTVEELILAVLVGFSLPTPVDRPGMLRKAMRAS